MSVKRKTRVKRPLPLWLGLLLILLLAVLLLMLAMTPSPEPSAPPQRLALPQAPAVSTRPASQPSVPQPSTQRTVAESAPPVASKPVPQAVPNTVAKAVPPRAAAPATVATPSRGLALIIDDVGYNVRALKRVLSLSVPVAISVLPDAPKAVLSAWLAHQAGQVVMLHLPMQPQDPSLQMGEAFLFDGMGEQALRDTFQRDLARVPFVEGVNNHMGSKLTELAEPMRQVMQQCRQRGLFFVDSRTSRNSVAAQTAAAAGLSWATRQFFLDHIMSEDAMMQAWQRARACVRKGYRCVIIAHPRAASIDFLERHMTTEDAAHMVSIKQLLRRAQPAGVALTEAKQ